MMEISQQRREKKYPTAFARTYVQDHHTQHAPYYNITGRPSHPGDDGTASGGSIELWA